ncbi:cupin [Kordiimonas sediminis]|uniref:Cupin n=1 Tax=Kordiimonas sediminis TaxID=1735581 RepID=A0A919AU64_9PROT|nr:cupin domain-containing protein [Kordiimonas sediminis]GHF24348.1 cupin [Kordiimonas sediminis]
MEMDEVIRTLNLAPHPEGGYYRRTHLVESPDQDRGLMSSIYYLLPSGLRNAWHLIDVHELWVWCGGAPMEIAIRKAPALPNESVIIGPDLDAGQEPQFMIPADYWQIARSVGDWSLVTCVVSPEFKFSGHILADGDWDTGPLDIKT